MSMHARFTHALHFGPVWLSIAVLGVHLLRTGLYGMAVVAAAWLGLLLTRQRWVALVTPWLLLAAGGWWTGWAYAGQPASSAILHGALGVLTAGAAVAFRFPVVQQRYDRHIGTSVPSAISFAVVFVVLAFLQVRLRKPIPLMAERLLEGAGWMEAWALATYAAWLTRRILDARLIGPLRGRLWLLFSAVFFLQLLLGLTGFTVFLMTGKLHLPIPALILAGSIYRDTSLFMPILFTITVLLVGPAWCS